MHRDGVIIAVSGGLDSTVTAFLTVRSLGKENVKLVYMPERDSNPIHKKHAIILAKQLGCEFRIKNITSILWKLGTYQTLRLAYIPTRYFRKIAYKWGRNHLTTLQVQDYMTARLHPEPNSLVAKTNSYMITKHRVRMVLIYQMAEIENRMVVGAANRTEWMTGNFAYWGVDHCADVMPIVHLYRSQVEELAEFLNVPDFIRKKTADPDIMPIEDDKGKLIGGFKFVDQILLDFEHGVTKDKLMQSHDPALVDRVLTMIDYSRNMRESPYQIK